MLLSAKTRLELDDADVKILVKRTEDACLSEAYLRGSLR